MSFLLAEWISGMISNAKHGVIFYIKATISLGVAYLDFSHSTLFCIIYKWCFYMLDSLSRKKNTCSIILKNNILTLRNICQPYYKGSQIQYTSCRINFYPNIFKPNISEVRFPIYRIRVARIHLSNDVRTKCYHWDLINIKLVQYPLQ